MSQKRWATRCIRLPMDRETPLQQGASGGFVWRYAYTRAEEARTSGETGQDSLALRCNGERLVFALCDGVGESFFGDLAARFLSRALVQWLWTVDMTGWETVEMEVIMNRLLRNLTVPATRLVVEHPLPDSLTHVVRAVLEEKRGHGSQTSFVCARLDLPSLTLPEGGVLAAWVGDTRLRFWGPQGETAPPGGVAVTTGRWSTTTGVTAGSATIFRSSMSEMVEQVLAYTDGLVALDAEPSPPHPVTLSRQIRPPREDDCCFLSIAIRNRGNSARTRVQGRIAYY